MLEGTDFIAGHDTEGARLVRIGAAGLVQAEITNYGARLVALRVPDAHGRQADVVLGYSRLRDYLADRATYFGAVAGRYANRIAGGRFSLDGKEHRLSANEGANTLHGGERGFDAAFWSVAAVSANAIELRLRSVDGDQGFPGALDVTVTYAIEGNALSIRYSARTEAPTVLNLTNHAYFNLSGEGAATIEDHHLMVAASAVTPVGAGLVPTGAIESVSDSPFDFRRETGIGTRISAEHRQIEIAGGYDHNLVLDGGVTSTPRSVAHVHSPETGIAMTVATTEPGLQLYTGNFLDGSRSGKSGRAYGRRSGLCLETQHFPDSPNQPGFPSTVLRPDAPFTSTTIYSFRHRE